MLGMKNELGRRCFPCMHNSGLPERGKKKKKEGGEEKRKRISLGAKTKTSSFGRTYPGRKKKRRKDEAFSIPMLGLRVRKRRKGERGGGGKKRTNERNIVLPRCLHARHKKKKEGKKRRRRKKKEG